jgi:hypothetical protein
LVVAWRLVARFSAFRGIGHVLASAAGSATIYILMNLPSNRSPILFLIMPVAVVVIAFLAAVILAPRASRGKPPWVHSA